MMKWEAEGKGYTCNDCYLSMQNCHDMSICCEDETGLCDYFEEIPDMRGERESEECGYLGMSGYEDPESYCTVGVKDDDPKFDEDNGGCGCHYNARTLAKRKRENDYSEYLYYLGYSDYSLMPTMDYTEENKRILEKHRELIRHALGMDNRKTYVRHGKRFYRPYRNYFFTHKKTVDYPYWERLVVAGLAEKEESPTGVNYFVTRSGMDWLGQHDGIHIYDEED